MGYEFVDHTADVQFVAYGKTLEEAFENAAMAFFDAQLEISKVECKIKRTIKVHSEDRISLLYDFLSELLYIQDTEGLVFSEFNVSISGNHLVCEMCGEHYDINKHGQKSPVKAITYHNMKIEEDNGYKITVVLDV